MRKVIKASNKYIKGSINVCLSGAHTNHLLKLYGELKKLFKKLVIFLFSHKRFPKMND